MKRDDWVKRIKERSDMVTRVTHLTKENDDDEAFENLWKILNDKEIKGSGANGFINGKRKAVCLQELPLSAIAENLMYEQVLNDKIRYSSFGVRFNKAFIYRMGGRPVIYENKEHMKALLNEEEYWRIVDLDLSDKEKIVDWTHEREWRVPDKLPFKYTHIEVIVANDKYYRKFVKRCIDEDRTDILVEIHGIITLNSVCL